MIGGAGQKSCRRDDDEPSANERAAAMNHIGGVAAGRGARGLGSGSRGARAATHGERGAGHLASVGQSVYASVLWRCVRVPARENAERDQGSDTRGEASGARVVMRTCGAGRRKHRRRQPEALAGARRGGGGTAKKLAGGAAPRVFGGDYLVIRVRHLIMA